jgi:hypothetical protein
MRCLLTIGLFAIFTGLIGRVFGLHLEFQAAEVVLLCVCFAVSRWALPLVERYDRGAEGEEYVGQILDELDPGWFVIHDAHLERSNVDHIVIGPPGLFTIETKSNAGPIRVHRLHGRLIRQAHHEREQVQRVSGIRTEPLVVYSRAEIDRPGHRRKGVRVLPAEMLRGYLDRRAHRLDPDQVREIHRRLVEAFEV